MRQREGAPSALSTLWGTPTRPLPLRLPPQMRTVRVRLAIWNVSILAAALLLFIVLLRYQVQWVVSQAVDKDMQQFGDFILDHPSDSHGPGPRFVTDESWYAHPDEDGPDGPPQDDGDGPPRRGKGRHRPRHDMGPMPNQGDGPLGTPVHNHPRLLDFTGRVIGHEKNDTGTEPWDTSSFRQARDTDKDVYATVLIDGEPTRVYSHSVQQPQGTLRGIIQVARPLTEANWVLDNVSRTMWLLTPVCLVLAGAGGVFLTSRALRPVRSMAQAASMITAQELSGRLPETGGDEFAHLAATFNGMLTRLETSFEQQRRFTSDASHELRTPLAAIKAHTSLALRGEREASELRQAIVAADAAVDRASRTVQDLLLLARSDTGRLGLRLESVDLPDVLLGAIDTLEMAHHEPIALIELGVSAPPPPIRGDAHHLTRLFTNLLENAIRHTPTSGKITVQVDPTEDGVRVTVRDTGEGISPEHLPHIGERFYRVDASRARAQSGGGGTGLGFAICRSIVDAHSGSLALESTLGIGTQVYVTLPLAADAEAAHAA